MLLGRAVTGLGVGVSFAVTPVYIAEITPARLRGALGAVFDVPINVGIVLGYVVGFAVETRVSRANVAWRLMLGSLVLPVVLLTLPALPESPRWLVARGARADALRVLRAISADEAEARATADAAAAEVANDRDAPVTWRELLVAAGRALRRLALLVRASASGSRRRARRRSSTTRRPSSRWGGEREERRARDPAPTARARLVCRAALPRPFPRFSRPQGGGPRLDAPAVPRQHRGRAQLLPELGAMLADALGGARPSSRAAA